jgi:hypothetical protein
MANDSNSNRQDNLMSSIGATIHSEGFPIYYNHTSKMRRDQRVRISLPQRSKKMFYGSATDDHMRLLKPLKDAGGVVFPFVPQIIINNAANYNPQSPAHSNYPYQVYQNSNIGTINLFGQFSAQTRQEAEYVLATILFMRLATKSFRNNDPAAGNPPIILRLTGHGQNLLPNVPVVIQSFDLTLPNSVDYIQVNPNAGTAENVNVKYLKTDNVDYIPTMTDISITMTPVYSRSDLTKYRIGDIANGDNLKGFM